eukprot:TRINITY_DN50997_c0_g1_i1.p1 TRINITY_DN50997_c0_g1~~TRINITY_DN50997_c0_g1_i1.p1  ORF type:complete len:286 (+),score=42.50 TRINITY_DN50997_c0_g1_i1:197-1054(+)
MIPLASSDFLALLVFVSPIMVFIAIRMCQRRSCARRTGPFVLSEKDERIIREVQLRISNRRSGYSCRQGQGELPRSDEEDQPAERPAVAAAAENDSVADEVAGNKDVDGDFDEREVGCNNSAHVHEDDCHQNFGVDGNQHCSSQYLRKIADNSSASSARARFSELMAIRTAGEALNVSEAKSEGKKVVSEEQALTLNAPESAQVRTSVPTEGRRRQVSFAEEVAEVAFRRSRSGPNIQRSLPSSSSTVLDVASSGGVVMPLPNRPLPALIHSIDACSSPSSLKAW